DCVADRALLGRGARGAAEAHVDDLRAVIDRVDDCGRLVDVGDRAVRRRDLDGEQLRVASEARYTLGVRGRAGRQGRDEDAVTVVVRDVRRAAAHAPRRGGFGGQVRGGDIRARIDDGDRDRRGRM